MALRRLSFYQQKQSWEAYNPRGSFNAWISFMAPGPRNPDGSEGDPVEFISCWASVQAVFAQQTKEAQQIVKNVTHLVVTHYIPGLNESMTIVILGRTFQIEGIMDPDERKMELRYLCIERDQNA